MNELNLDYRLNKRAKRISIRLTEFGDVIVNVPKESMRLKAEKFVLENLPWIHSKVAAVKSKGDRSNSPLINLKIETGEKIILFDDSIYTLELKLASKNYYKLNEDSEKLVLYADKKISNQSDLHKAYLKLLKKFYVDSAREIFEERSAFFANKLGVGFNKIAIKDQSTRWGSCSSDKNLNFNFRVLLAPERVLDYLVIHEVCHLVEMNHSSKFWNLVESLMPDYKDAKKWLTDNGFLLKYYLKS
jgi:predicted metal-dependent hydrolase